MAALPNEERANSESAGTASDDPHRHLEELLQEIRVALPGVQVLFAFLLTVAFTDRFAKLESTNKAIYMAALLLAALTSALLIAPAAFHRLQHGETTTQLDRLIRDATFLYVAATATLAAALTACTYLVARVAYAPVVSAAVGVGTAAMTIALWFVLPLLRRNAG